MNQRGFGLAANHADVVHELEALPGQHADEQRALSQERSELRRRMLLENARATTEVTAPVSGVVAALQVGQGGFAVPGKPLLTLLPVRPRLEGVLLIPSNAVGFTRPGMPVRLSVDAFPHQHFGTLPAVLSSISETPVAAASLLGLVTVNAPVYVARARLLQQHVVALGARQPLRSGMQLSADLILEGRSLLEWLLEPMHRLRGRTR